MTSPNSNPAKVEEAYLKWCLAEGKPYFGNYFVATQGQPVRHA